MTPGMVSVLIPSRNERFLIPTIRDVLAHAAGPLEVVVVLDGYWPDEPLPDDLRVRTVHFGAAQGMRPAINAAAAVAQGQWLMKLDAHCSLTEGFDVVLKTDCDEDWVAVPRRDRLDPIAWALQVTGKPPIDAHYLSYPFERPGDPSCGLHGTVWNARAAARKSVLVDDEMSSQGSCWFMSRRHWDRFFPDGMSIERYGNFIQEFQEIGLTTWLGGGRVVVNKRVQYLHLHKGKTYGRGYFISSAEQSAGAAFATDYWMHNRWPERARDLSWLIERFWPVPGWPVDWERETALRQGAPVRGAREIMARKPRVGAKDEVKAPGVLTINAAHYGITREESVDVTERVRALAAGGRLEIDVKNDVLGVSPFRGVRKQLIIDYEVDGVAAVATAIERGRISIPPAQG